MKELKDFLNEYVLQLWKKSGYYSKTKLGNGDLITSYEYYRKPKAKCNENAIMLRFPLAPLAGERAKPPKPKKTTAQRLYIPVSDVYHAEPTAQTAKDNRATRVKAKVAKIVGLFMQIIPKKTGFWNV